MNLQSFSSCPPTLPSPTWLEYDGVRISWDVPVAFIHDKPMQLDRRSFALLYYLMANKGRTLTKNQLLDHVWGNGKDVDENTVATCACRVRKALAAGGRSYLLRSVWGCGYCFGGEV